MALSSVPPPQSSPPAGAPSTAPITVVRLATPEDAPAIARIYNQGIEERVATFETERRTPEAVAAQLRERGDRYPTVVVERDGVVIGFATVGPYRSRPCYAGVDEFSVYTERAARRAGAGRAALEGLIRACTERGFWKLVSRVFPENAASRALHRRAGFREVGVYRRHAQLEGQWRDCVIIEKLLGEAAEGEP
ncbi:MAG TPA: arsinothricin resistance N-acetyltransferase ArsN1 family A [Chloroflexota bacterium]|nr:arsinothricin resistance N-acetyltransferase ArsN1 family A [Chloroflexota bacterium]